MTLTIPITDELAARLTAKAKLAGVDLSTYAATLLDAKTPRVTLEELAAETSKAFAESGMSDDEFSELLEQEKHAMRAEKRARS